MAPRTKTVRLQPFIKGDVYMRALFETLFDIVYLVTVITLGIRMIRGSKGNRQFQLFGWMAVVLGAGDSFHLVPRAGALHDRL